MRDPKRIPKILDRLRTVWEANPDFRLAQLIGNAYSVPAGDDPYYVEDDEFITGIEIANTWD